MAVSVPDYVSTAAKRGLEWHDEGKSGDGVTDQTLREARDMAEGSVSEDKVRRMGPWFQRHRPDMDAPKNDPANEDFPGAGAVAWALWGGPTSGDLMRTADWAEAKVKQLDQEQVTFNSKPYPPHNRYNMTIEERFKAAEAAVVSLTAERDDLRKTVEASVVDVSAELEAVKVTAASQDQKVQELEIALAEANAKIVELEASKSTASAEAAVILAASGVDPVAAPVAQAVVGSICEQYAAMPVGAERRAFFKKHKAVLFSAK